MAFNEIERARLRRAIVPFMEARRPPAHIRQKLDLSYRLVRQSLEIFEVRPKWRGAPDETMENPVAKATFVKARGSWNVFWYRADLKWHAYEPTPHVPSIERFLAIVAEDTHGCFFG